MRIGELAERVGVSTRTLRHYEELGLLSAGRATNGYRSYDVTDLRVAEQIRSLVEIGFSLDETRPFVACLRDGNESADACPASLHAYRSKLREIDECMARLREARARLTQQLCAATQLHEVADHHADGVPDPACTFFPSRGTA